MARLLLAFAAVLCYTSFIDAKAVTITPGVRGWYWRDILIKGETPKNALPAGIDSKGDTTYIGQVPHYAGETIVPGAYVPRLEKVFYEYGRKQWTAESNIKVLCTQEPDNFKWVPSKKGQPIKTEDGWELVPGGAEFNKISGIGRVKIEDELVQGKVNLEGNSYELLHYNRNGNGITSSEFEVLYYVKSGCSDDGVIITIN